MNELQILREENEILTFQADSFFRAHETLVVRLCEILKLDYTLATDEEVLEVVKNLMDSHGE